MKKYLLLFFLFVCSMNVNSQTQYKHPTIDYFANDIIYVHKHSGNELKFLLLNRIFICYSDWDRTNILKIKDEFGERRQLKLKDKYNRAERDVNVFLDSMRYFLETYPDSSNTYESCIEYLRAALYSMRDLNSAIQKHTNKSFRDSATMIPVDKKASIEIVVADVVRWKLLYQQYAGEVGTEKYIQILNGSYWKSWEELLAESAAK